MTTSAASLAGLMTSFASHTKRLHITHVHRAHPHSGEKQPFDSNIHYSSDGVIDDNLPVPDGVPTADFPPGKKVVHDSSDKLGCDDLPGGLVYMRDACISP